MRLQVTDPVFTSLDLALAPSIVAVFVSAKGRFSSSSGLYITIIIESWYLFLFFLLFFFIFLCRLSKTKEEINYHFKVLFRREEHLRSTHSHVEPRIFPLRHGLWCWYEPDFLIEAMRFSLFALLNHHISAFVVLSFGVVVHIVSNVLEKNCS